MRDSLIGTRIDRYEIREFVRRSDLIGIYKAYDTKLERPVFLKTILHASDYSKEAIDLFLAESKTLARLVHPNITKVLDFGHKNGQLYLTNEYVLGQPLTDFMNHPLPWQKAIDILLPLTNALLYAHSRGIIHRDLKPDNIIINTDDQPILSDFSLIRIIEEEETRDMTAITVGLGSPEYISPEQGQGLPADFRSDIYSLGVIFFEMVTGKKLFYASNSMEIVMQHIMADPPRPRSIIPTLPRAVETIILNALLKDREQRYQTMEEFANALKEIRETANHAHGPTAYRPHRLIAVAGILLAMIGLGWFFRDRLIPASPAPLPTSTPSPSLTAPDRTLTPARTEPTAVSSPANTLEASLDDPFAIYELSPIPVLPGNKLPISNQVLSVQNANSIQELARWGKPEINQITWINDDQVLVSATSAGIYFLDPQDLSARLFFDSAGSVPVFTISEDGEWIATGDTKGVVRIWNLLNGKELDNDSSASSRILSLDFSSDKSKLVFSDSSKTIYLWNFKQNQRPYPLENRLTANANKVLFSREGDLVISGDDSFQVILWDVPSAKLRHRFRATQRINDMAVTSDGRYLALALNESTIQIWDLSTQKRIKQIPGKQYGIFKPFTFITFQPNQSNIVTGSADGFVRVWNWNTFVDTRYIWEMTSAHQSENSGDIDPVKTVTLSSKGTKLVVGFESGLVELWDVTTQQRVVSGEFGPDPIKRIAISPDDRFLAFQRGESIVEILSMVNDSQNVLIHGALPRGNPISPDNRMIGIQAIQAGNLDVYPLSVSATPAPLFTLYDFPVNGSMNFSPDGKIVTAFSHGTLNYWSTSTGLQLKASAPKTIGQCRVIYRRDNSLIAAGSANGVIHFGKNLEYFCRVPRNPRTLSEEFLPDGSIIALALQNQQVEIWNHQREDMEPLDMETPGGVLDVAISSDGTLLAAAMAGGTIELYNLETMNMKPIKILNLQTGPVHHVLFSNKGEYLISGLADGTLRFFGLYQ